MKKLIAFVLLFVALQSNAQTSVDLGMGFNTDGYSVGEASIAHHYGLWNVLGGVYFPLNNKEDRETLLHLQVGRTFDVARDVDIVPAVGYGYSNGEGGKHNVVISTHAYCYITGRVHLYGGLLYATNSNYGNMTIGIRYVFKRSK